VLWKNNEFVHTKCFTKDISDLRRTDLQKLDLIVELQTENKALKAENDWLKRQLAAKSSTGNPS
jgi:regulator of replication initiation timing